MEEKWEKYVLESKDRDFKRESEEECVERQLRLLKVKNSKKQT
ncbi:uncharacterized protein G2W53_037530 [Senna tora]|uniref:Uncharacterized protein n=1 Tax=Senna tora TaxID=362788 RepID=A0A834W5Y3_9FABA|nr:uncharacterized protein G2W53_037530 [Senna tora]